MKCYLYPCFDITRGRLEKKKGVKWKCFGCKWAVGAKQDMKIIEKFFIRTGIEKIKFREPNRQKTASVIKTLKTLSGLGNAFFVLSADDKKKAFSIERKEILSNIGSFSCLTRDIVIAFSHDSTFRPPTLPEVLLASKGKIIGEQTNSGNIFYAGSSADELVLPPIPFPEISGKNVCSSSPSPELDKWLRKKMSVREEDATLLIGCDI